MSRKAVVIFSGGQDSTTCLIHAKAIFDEVIAISFDYGQRHFIELEQARKICNYLNVKHIIINIKGAFSNNALIDSTKEITQGEKYPNTFVEGRNALFILHAAIFAKQNDIKDIILGVCQIDYSGYPDCRQNFIDSMEYSISLAMDYNFKIHTPLMNLSKFEIWKFAYDLGYLEFVRDWTHSCYIGKSGGCGNCPSCNLREISYIEFENWRSKQ